MSNKGVEISVQKIAFNIALNVPLNPERERSLRFSAELQECRRPLPGQAIGAKFGPLTGIFGIAGRQVFEREKARLDSRQTTSVWSGE